MADATLQSAIGMALDGDGVRRLVTLLPLASARPLGYILLLPIFGRFHLNVGYLRGALTAALILPVLPAAIAAATADPAILSPTRLPVLIVAEFLVGAILGLLAGLPMWAASAAGDFLDMQRGAQMAQMIDPGSPDQQAITGTLLLLVCILVLASKGILIPALYGPVFDSYDIVPLFSPLPRLDPAQGELALRLLDTLTRTGLILAMPIIVPLLLIEMAVAVATKYIPQLNAMILAMALKQGVYALLILVAATLIATYALTLSGSDDLRPAALDAFLSGAAR